MYQRNYVEAYSGFSLYSSRGKRNMSKFKFVLVFVLLAVLVSAAFAQDTLVNVASNDDLGEFLVGEGGMTLYIFTPDPLGETVCYDRCAENWPPLLVESADDITYDMSIAGTFGTVERTDTDSLQVTYNGLPLYYFANDAAAGDVNGQARGNVWWVVPTGEVYLLRNDELGHILVGPNGMTLYLFSNDEMGDSVCYDQCAENWPPLLVESADALSGDPRLPGELGTTERTDGTLQVTYNGWPLYYFIRDEAIGDTVGEAANDVWWTISPEVALVGSTDELGSFLVDANGMTLYMFTNDEMGVSNCAETCLENWPAFTLYEGDRLFAEASIMGEWGTLTRDDGAVQITYNGMPLYYFAGDEAPGDVNGQGLNDVWFVVEP